MIAHVFIKKIQIKIYIKFIYMDEWNIISNPDDINEAHNHFKSKDLDKANVAWVYKSSIFT